MNLETAIESVERELNQLSTDVSGQMPLMVVKYIVKPYGWVFFYNTREFCRTGDPKNGLIGNGPIIVRSEDGRIFRLRSSISPEEEIAKWESEQVNL